MQSKKLIKAAVLALVLVLAFILAWEGYWRTKGYAATFNDDKALWAKKRAEVYQPSNKATVFIGSSRIKFDLDLATWRKLTGENAVQLALVGTSPMLLLKDLAEDTQFKGKLVVDITEVLFFSQNPVFHKSAAEATAFYKRQTPSEKLSSFVNLGLESQLAFLEEKRFSLTTLLNDLEVPNRPGVFSFPSFPKGFEWTTAERQTYMSEMFLNDTAEVRKVTDIWTTLIMSDKTPPTAGEALKAVFNDIKTAVDKIRSRGGEVIFVRTPSNGPMGDGEKKAYPREKYWDALLAFTGSQGIHYSDYPETAGLICPEWSHLSPEDAITYTEQLVKQLRGEGWFTPSNTL
ncbi:MAG TPA: hypothetical protein VEZ55_11995 [Chitinophagaceae bacterium]|nr:hypothetical protein [Chitinophagaceae bacterium]